MEDYVRDKEVHYNGFDETWCFSCKDDWYKIEDLFSGRSEISHYNPKIEKCKRMTCLEWYYEYVMRSMPQLVDADHIYDEDENEEYAHNQFLGFEKDPFDVVETFETLDEFKKYCGETFFPVNIKSAKRPRISS